MRGVAFSADGHLVASGSFDGTVRLWETRLGTSLRTVRAERCYERLDITGLTGVTDAERAALLALGAVEHSRSGASAAGVRQTLSEAVDEALVDAERATGRGCASLHWHR